MINRKYEAILRTLNNSTRGVQDVDLEIELANDVTIELGDKINGTIVKGPAQPSDNIWVNREYPTFDVPELPGDFGAKIIEPSGLPKVLKVGEKLIIEVIAKKS